MLNLGAHVGVHVCGALLMNTELYQPSAYRVGYSSFMRVCTKFEWKKPSVMQFQKECQVLHTLMVLS